mgnify:CR=1 FL=1
MIIRYRRDWLRRTRWLPVELRSSFREIALPPNETVRLHASKRSKLQRKNFMRS